MTGFLSADWYRVADLRPRRRLGVRVVRQVHRGTPWFVLQDPVSGKGHRLGQQGHHFFALADGTRTVQDLWQIACRAFPDRPPTQSEVVTLIAQLHQADLVVADRMPDLSDLVRRAGKHRRQLLVAALKNPLALRLPLLDPGPFLDATGAVGRALFSRWGFALWALLLAMALGLVATHWQELGGNMPDRLFSVSSILPLVLAYVPVKLLHELGHGYALRRWGGEVREVGVMFLVFFPVPYVDASQSMMLPCKWQRISVSAAGILIETGLAALATLVWVLAEPGALRATAFNVMLIGGVSTVLFNGNPLLRFDGYFVLSDLLESPNLAQRANAYFWYLCERHILGVEEALPPQMARNERGWLLSYAIAAFAYRVLLLILISLFIAARFLGLGILLAVWSLIMAFGVPAFKGMSFLVQSPRLAGQRPRAVFRAGVALAALAGLVVLMPLPSVTTTVGYLRDPARAQLRAGTDGVVSEVLAPNGVRVLAGDPVLVLEVPELERLILVATATLRDLEMRRAARPLEDGTARAALERQVAFARSRLDDLEARREARVLRAPEAGIVVLPEARDLAGRFLAKGQAVGILRTGQPPVVQAAVPQRRAGLVTEHTRAVELRFRTAAGAAAHVARIVPESTTRLPSAALTSVAGGYGLLVDPRDPEGRASLEPAVLLELAPDGLLPASALVGERVLVRFTHPPEPLAQQLWRSARQTFLSVVEF